MLRLLLGFSVFEEERIAWWLWTNSEETFLSDDFVTSFTWLSKREVEYESRTEDNKMIRNRRTVENFWALIIVMEDEWKLNVGDNKILLWEYVEVEIYGKLFIMEKLSYVCITYSHLKLNNYMY